MQEISGSKLVGQSSSEFRVRSRGWKLQYYPEAKGRQGRRNLSRFFCSFVSHSLDPFSRRQEILSFYLPLSCLDSRLLYETLQSDDKLLVLETTKSLCTFEIYYLSIFVIPKHSLLFSLFICTRLNDIKYFYRIQIIWKQIYLFKERTLSSTNTPG